MDILAKQQLRAYITLALTSHDDRRSYKDNESLFVSGRLDFLAMMNLVMHLEQNFGIEFSNTEFDVVLLDSLEQIELLIDRQVKS